MRPNRAGVTRLLVYLGTALLLWAIYAISVSLGGIFVFWIYVGLFAASAITYVILLRGNLSAPPKEVPEGVEPAAWEAFREDVLARRKRYALLPPLAFGTLLCLLLDYINLFWFNGMFL